MAKNIRGVTQKIEQLTVKLKLSKKLKQHLEYLENISGKSKEFIFQEALIRYIEDIEDIQKLSVWEALGILDENRNEIISKNNEISEHLRTNSAKNY